MPRIKPKKKGVHVVRSTSGGIPLRFRERSCELRRDLEHAIVFVMKTALIISDPDILGGTPVFAGTRVPVKNLTDCLESGESIDTFIHDFPSVSRTQVVDFLEAARVQVTADALEHA